METFVHGEVEVKKTGRTAQKPAPGGKIMVLAEITPVNDYDGNWKKWVNPQALFTIIDHPDKDK
jgi:hypothetical protein